MEQKTNIKKIEERFWKKVQKTKNCWIWIGGKMSSGYGHFYLSGKFIGAHRVAWMLSNGEIPSGLSVLHKCDIKLCVFPNHLFIGTQLDNIRDMQSKNRHKTGNQHWTKIHPERIRRGFHVPRECRNYGERNGQSKLNEVNVRKILTSYKTGLLTQTAIAKIFKISRQSVSDIVRGTCWSHIKSHG